MAGARPLELGLELIVHNAVQRFIRQLKTERLPPPLLHSKITGKTGRGSQTRRELLEHSWREGLLPPRRPSLFVCQQGGQAALTIAAEPGGNGMTMQSQMDGSLAPRGHLPRFEEH